MNRIVDEADPVRRGRVGDGTERAASESSNSSHQRQTADHAHEAAAQRALSGRDLHRLPAVLQVEDRALSRVELQAALQDGRPLRLRARALRAAAHSKAANVQRDREAQLLHVRREGIDFHMFCWLLDCTPCKHLRDSEKSSE